MFKKNHSIPILILILLFLIFVNQKVLAGDISDSIIINEVFFDPIGSDSGKEWIELYNPTPNSIEMIDWKILVAGSTFTESTNFSGLIPSHEYFLICESSVQGCNVNVTKLAMQNGGGATDAISLNTNTNLIIDQVFYDLPNTYGLKNSDNVVVADLDSAIIGVSGESIGRKDFIDTNISADDFFVYSSPTPGSENIGELVEEELPQTGDSPLIYLIILIILIFSGILLNKHNLFLITKWLRLQKRYLHRQRQ